MKYFYYSLFLLLTACVNRIGSSNEFKYMGFDNSKSSEINDYININDKKQLISIVESVQETNILEYLNAKKSNLIFHEQKHNGVLYFAKIKHRDAIFSNGIGKWYIILERHRVID